MADKKISQLTGATTPLAGTEVLPIVQSSTTVKVATNDLTVKNVRSNATSGILQIAGPAAASTRTMTTPDANFTVARTDAANSFTGDQTLSTGNIIQGTAAKGVNYTANTPAAGMTSQLLNWYEEGTWTPAFSFQTPGNLSITYVDQIGRYTRIGNRVTAQCFLVSSTFTHTTASGYAKITGMPFNANSTSGLFNVGALFFSGFTIANYTNFAVSTEPSVNNAFLIYASASALAYKFLDATHFPTGGTVKFIFSISYQI